MNRGICPSIPEKMDVVYTWVDDTWPGYKELLGQYGKTEHDFNPNRTRDNLQTLKFSLRSLDAFAPWVNHIYIVSMRPQVPEWLDTNHPKISIIHHDRFIPDADLPTFNSLSLTANLHRLPINSERFLYFEDDMLLLRNTPLSDFLTQDGKLRVFPRILPTPDEKIWQERGRGPWDLAIANSNRLLNRSFGRKNRSHNGRVPLWIEKSWWAEMWGQWPEDFELTSASKFRSQGNVAPEYIYPYFCLETGKAEAYTIWQTHRRSGYIGLENNTWLNRLGFLKLAFWNPSYLVMNDNFGPSPQPPVESQIRKYLCNRFPNPSPFERA